MVLKYYEGANFGDAINPLIFNTLLPGFFDNDEKVWFLGIGSTLGFIRADETIRKIIVFSTGFAYDSAPVPDARYDIRCVRGPLTAKALKLKSNAFITDGAVLLRSLPMFHHSVEKKFRYSFIPHHQSEAMYDRWQQLFSESGINFISPSTEPVKAIEQIRQSEYVITEAMHGAIIADTFRVPWIPLKMFEHINEFKWKDWLLSLGSDYKPQRIFRLYNPEWISWIIRNKSGFSQSSFPNRLLSGGYRIYQNTLHERQFRRDLCKIIEHAEPLLSKNLLIKEKEEQLLEKLESIKKDYM